MNDPASPIGDAAPFDISDQLSARLAQLGQEHCVFTRGGQLYAVSVSAAREVLIGESATPVPQAPPALIGVLNLRGEVLPLVQLDTLLGIPSHGYTPEDHILVLSCNGIDVGLSVDRVREVRPIDPKEVKGAPANIPGRALCRGCWQSSDGVVAILDAERVVALAVNVVSSGFRDRRAAQVRGAGGSSHV